MSKILVIEDDYNLRTSIRDLLEEYGYSVYLAGDGKEGLQLLKEFIPDLILCDVMMPRLDGYGTLQQLNSEFNNLNIPFIYLSAKAELQDFRRGMELGADDYLTKPFKAVELLKAIEVRLKKKQTIMQNSFPGKNQGNENNRLKEDDNLFINTGNKPQLVLIREIISITAFNEYSIINMKSGEKFTVRKSLSNWENTLPQNTFLRIHRSTIINVNYIAKMEKWFKKSFRVSLKHLNAYYIISQRYAAKLKSTHFIK